MSRILTAALLTLSLAGVVSVCAAQSDIGFKGIGAEVGLVDPENFSSAVGFGAIADLGTIFNPNVGLELSGRYWGKSSSTAAFLGVPSITTKFHDTSFGAMGKYNFALSTTTAVRPYVGAGVALHLLHSSAKVAGVGNSANDTKAGLDILGGALLGNNPNIKFLGEVGYRFVSNLNQFVARGGVMYTFGSRF